MQSYGKPWKRSFEPRVVSFIDKADANFKQPLLVSVFTILAEEIMSSCSYRCLASTGDCNLYSISVKGSCGKYAICADISV